MVLSWRLVIRSERYNGPSSPWEAPFWKRAGSTKGAHATTHHTTEMSIFRRRRIRDSDTLVYVVPLRSAVTRGRRPPTSLRTTTAARSLTGQPIIAPQASSVAGAALANP